MEPPEARKFPRRPGHKSIVANRFYKYSTFGYDPSANPRGGLRKSLYGKLRKEGPYKNSRVIRKNVLG